ncbi:MAG: Grx4 family monothiol glutaredoxin [Deltaproteobacteria bacterium]
MDETVKRQIQQLVDANRVVLFMKGTKNFPQCGFSHQVVQILKEVGADFETVNVLADPVVRQGIKDFANWPTIPQLYVDGKFVGGCDIVRDMFESGELAPLVKTGPTS